LSDGNVFGIDMRASSADCCGFCWSSTKMCQCPRDPAAHGVGRAPPKLLLLYSPLRLPLLTDTLSPNLSRAPWLRGSNTHQGADVVMMVVGMQGRWGAEELRQRREFVERLAKTCGNYTDSDVSTRHDGRRHVCV